MVQSNHRLKTLPREDLPDQGLQAGDLGAVVMEHGDGEGYEVEFVTLSGETVAVVSLLPHQVRAIGRREIAHARTVQMG
ncbi:MAG: DUF4926 domain-containing protein [Isosphaeraceae bacterium]